MVIDGKKNFQRPYRKRCRAQTSDCGQPGDNRVFERLPLPHLEKILDLFEFPTLLTRSLHRVGKTKNRTG